MLKNVTASRVVERNYFDTFYARYWLGTRLAYNREIIQTRVPEMKVVTIKMILAPIIRGNEVPRKGQDYVYERKFHRQAGILKSIIMLCSEIWIVLTCEELSSRLLRGRLAAMERFIGAAIEMTVTISSTFAFYYYYARKNKLRRSRRHRRR